MLVHENTDLLVAWAGEAEMACESANTPVDLGDREGVVVQPLDRCEQRRTDARCLHGHVPSLVRRVSRHCHRTVPIPA